MSTTLEDVIRAISASLTAEVNPLVVMSTHTDYTEFAALPAVILFYPELSEWTPNEKNEKQITSNNNGTNTIRPPRVFKNLDFEIQIVGERMIGAGGIMQLQTNFIIWLQKHRIFTVGGIDYEIHGQEPQKPLYSANLSNLKRVDAHMTVQGVEIDTGQSDIGYQARQRIFDMEIR